MRSRAIPILPVMFLLLALALTGAVAADRKFEKTFVVQPGGTLILKADIGDVKVTGTDTKEVRILCEMRGRQRELDAIDISASETAEGVEVRARYDRPFSWFFGGLEADVKFTLVVPREFNVRAQTSGGDIAASSLRGKVKLTTSGGDVRLRDVDGPIEVSTSGGDISGEALAGRVTVETSGGDIVVKSVTGDIEASTSGGDIRLSEIDGAIRAETSGGDITVDLRGENKGIFAETSGGDITLQLDSKVAATLDASTIGGDVTCDLPITTTGKLDESKVRGTINGGGKRIHAHTSGGDVRIRSSESGTSNSR